MAIRILHRRGCGEGRAATLPAAVTGYRLPARLRTRAICDGRRWYGIILKTGAMHVRRRAVRRRALWVGSRQLQCARLRAACDIPRRLSKQRTKLNEVRLCVLGFQTRLAAWLRVIGKDDARLRAW